MPKKLSKHPKLQTAWALENRTHEVREAERGTFPSPVTELRPHFGEREGRSGTFKESCSGSRAEGRRTAAR